MLIVTLILLGCGPRETSAERRQREAVDLCYKGYDYLKAKDPKNAETQFKQALELDPFCDKARAGIATIAIGSAELKAENVEAESSPRIIAIQKRYDIQNTQAHVGMLGHCLDRYAEDCKKYPTNKQGLDALLNKPADLDDSVDWNGPYISMDTLPKDHWGHDYKYAYPSTHGAKGPDVWSIGPDGINGNDDDIGTWSQTAR
jgi:general secretion pathway protein G